MFEVEYRVGVLYRTHLVEMLTDKSLDAFLIWAEHAKSNVRVVRVTRY